MSILNIALAASLLSAPAVAAPSVGSSPPRTRTEPALACLLGFARWQCENDFFDPPTRRALRGRKVVGRGFEYCANKYQSSSGFCPDGRLEAVDYLGTNARGDDVYEVQYRHAEATYVLQQPNRDGKVEEAWIRRGNSNAIIPAYLIAVPPQNAHKVRLYGDPSQ